jgi:hypothetical protein
MTRNQLLALILQEVLRITETTQHAAFMNYSGHVDKVLIYVCASKEDYINWIWERDVFMGPDFADPTPKLRAILRHLKTYA